MDLANTTRLCMIQGGHFSTSRGGAQYQAEVLVDRLVETEMFDITYITRNVAADFAPEGYRVERISTPSRIKRAGFFLDWPQLMGMLKRLQPDVIYQQGLKAHTGIAARYARKSGARFVFHVASDFDVLPASELAGLDFSGVSPLDKRLGEWGLRHADDVIAQTIVQQEFLEKHYFKSPCAIVRNFHPLPGECVERGRTLRVIWVANFKPVKRPEAFVALAEAWKDRPECQFVMVGRGGNDATYADLHRRIAALDNLEYLGEISQEAVNKEIARSHILVNTSIMEGFPNTFVQAWMRGLPVVTMGVNSDRLFDERQIGICTADPNELLSTLGDLARVPETIAEMGRHARKYAFDNHTMKNVDQLVALLEK